ncbi:inositol monophosphatase [Patescibacteria group bacterium]|nr:inositol monophosphatase [Patescibacteria group bacterium]
MYEKEADIAISVANEAGEILRSAFKSKHANNITYKKHNEPVSEVDLASNKIIIERLKSAFPNYSILSEEMENSDNFEMSDQLTWVIDPLDGTSNFTRGIPLFAITIALIKDKEPVLGLIYDPIQDELFLAEAGKGTTLNGEKIMVSDRDMHGRRMLMAGRAHDNESVIRHGQILYALEKTTSYFRRLGSAAIMLTTVACGRTEGVILTGAKSWDTAAGALLVKEAGGGITDYCGHPWNVCCRDLVASNGHIHEEIIKATETIEAAECTYDPDCTR